MQIPEDKVDKLWYLDWLEDLGLSLRNDKKLHTLSCEYMGIQWYQVFVRHQFTT